MFEMQKQVGMKTLPFHLKIWKSFSPHEQDDIVWFDSGILLNIVSNYSGKAQGNLWICNNSSADNL